MKGQMRRDGHWRVWKTQHRNGWWCAQFDVKGPIIMSSRYKPLVTLDFTRPLACVEVTEYERGWGQRTEETLLFLTEGEAQQYVEQYNKRSMPPVAHVPDEYTKAQRAGFRTLEFV